MALQTHGQVAHERWSHGGEQEEEFLQRMKVVQAKGEILKYLNSGKPKQSV